jgi:hypothetical protein
MTGSNNDDRRAINPSFKFRRELQPTADPNKLPTLPYYTRHPEHRPRPPSKRQLRRRIIRGG